MLVNIDTRQTKLRLANTDYFTHRLCTSRIYGLLLMSKSFAETLRRIKERTRLAMQDPKVKSCKNGFMYSCGYKNGYTYSC